LIFTCRQINGLDCRTDDSCHNCLLFVVHLVVEGIRKRGHHLVRIVSLRCDAVYHHLAFVTNNDETLRVSDDLLNVETVARIVIQRSLNLTSGGTEDKLTLVGTHEYLAIGQPAMCRIVLRDMTVLFLSEGAHLVLQGIVFLDIKLVSLITGDKDIVRVKRTETNLSSNGVSSIVAHSLLRETPLFIDLPNVDSLFGFGTERCEKLVVTRTEGHGHESFVHFYLC